ncbi:MAG: inorganic phosphate transporter [Bryobacteraceae bacterium]|nr:inorganic phosphate transporter [Bryobacteraceae bacterium]
MDLNPALTLAVAIIAVALIFDFINGFHDAANSIATVVATRVLTPGQAVIWAAFFNFIAAFAFGTQVAKTVVRGVNLDVISVYVILAGLIGAIVWDLITWWLGLPTSSSHALLGGYAGAGMAKVALERGISRSFEAINPEAWIPTLIFIVLAPLLGVIIAYLLMAAIYWLFRRQSPRHMDQWFRRLQLLSAAVFSYSHGTNDAQKTMGIITGVLFTSGFIPSLSVPIWVIFAAHTAIGLGTLSGGWRIVHTMGSRLTRLKPRGGFAAETAAAISILFSSELGMPVSTTHVIAGAIVGVGSIQRVRAVRWGIARRIVWAWFLTIPAAALVGALSLLLLRLLTPDV